MSSKPAFAPVPRQRSRHDGWSAEKQAAFIEALAEHGIVRAAAAAVGMNPASAYRLRDAEGAKGFAEAWDAAVRIGAAQLIDIAMERAINGVAVPHYYQGEQVGEHRWYDNRLLMFLLQHRHAEQFGRYAAEVEMAERLSREESAAEARRLAQLERAEALLAAINTELDLLEDAADAMKARGQAADPATLEQINDLTQKRERLDALVLQLRRVDGAREAEASIDAMVAAGHYSARIGNKFKQRLAMAPSDYG